MILLRAIFVWGEDEEHSGALFSNDGGDVDLRQVAVRRQLSCPLSALYTTGDCVLSLQAAVVRFRTCSTAVFQCILRTERVCLDVLISLQGVTAASGAAQHITQHRADVADAAALKICADCLYLLSAAHQA